MACSTDDALKIAKAFLVLAAQQHEIVRAYLFGSYVDGRQKGYSDIDLAVVLGGPSASPARYLQEAREIFHEAQEYNPLLEVICFRVEEFEENGASIIGLIKKEGIRINESLTVQGTELE
ncbi:MAG: nucleotidyltransferase domain-containing protein [candidate division NC10 bacterium]|nr:nucleotidyltransferase domain-containing protein [candidate division NC10 bacterium]